LWKQESFVVLRSLRIEFFRNLLGWPVASEEARYNPLSLSQRFRLAAR